MIASIGSTYQEVIIDRGRHRYDDGKLERSRRRYRAEAEIHKPAVA